ncbi:hypothetical protein Tco_0880346 [Tanacetum coccineum]
MAESAKRHEENSNIIKEIRDFTDATIRNQGASIKTLEIQIGQISKVLQERGIGGLLGSTEPNPRDHVKSISTTKADSSKIRRMGCSPYTAQDVKILEAYDHTLPQKEKDPGCFTLLCFIHNVCFDKALVELGASTFLDPNIDETQKFTNEVDELRVISGYVLGAPGVQIPQNNLDNLRSIKEEDGTSEIVDPQD